MSNEASTGKLSLDLLETTIFIMKLQISDYHNDGVGSFTDIQASLPVAVDLVLCDEALSREAQEHTGRTALAHLVSQHDNLQEEHQGSQESNPNHYIQTTTTTKEPSSHLPSSSGCSGQHSSGHGKYCPPAELVHN